MLVVGDLFASKMSFKLDVDRLNKEELIWELKVRGIAESDNVDALRKSLRSALALEKNSSHIHRESFNADAVEELTICEAKIKEIESSITGFSGLIGQCKKIETKIAHSHSRLEWINSDDTTLMRRRAALLRTLMEITATYQSKHTDLVQPGPSQPHVAPTDPRFQASLVQTAGNVTPPFPQTSSPVGHSTLNQQGASNIPAQNSFKSIPVYKWQIKFSGHPHESLNAFLEEVEEHCQSRNVDKAQLFSSARDLFAGDALRMYNWFKRYASDWDSLVRLLKEEYVPPAEKLWEQILNRTQGVTESIGLYVATMTTLFDRMPTPVTSSLRMQVLRKNILPFFQERLALTEIQTPLELIELCRKIEETRVSVNNFKPPSLSTLTYEPDLNYSGNFRRPKGVVSEIDASHILCWRCRAPGHMAKDCPKKKHEFRCFGCGREGFTTKTCPVCNPQPSHSGNKFFQGKGKSKAIIKNCPTDNPGNAQQKQ